MTKQYFAKGFTRRRLLTGSVPAGLMLIAAPWVKIAHAQGAGDGKPKYVSWFTPLGQMPEWLPRGTTDRFGFEGISESLNPHKEKLIVLDGMQSEVGDHPAGALGMFTAHTYEGGNRRSYKKAKGPSIDTYIADGLGAKRLALGVNTKNEQKGWMTFRKDGTPQAQQNNPAAVFDTLFQGAAIPEGGNSDRSAAIVRERRKSMLDAWLKDVESIKRSIGVDHRSQLDNHLNALRELEESISTTPDVSSSCANPGNPNLDAGNRDYINHGKIGEQQSTLLTAALACGFIQSASLMWGDGGSGGANFKGLTGFNDDQHKMTHAAGNPNGPVKFTVTLKQSEEGLRKIYRWYTERFAEFIDKLEAIPDGNGTMLDSTIITWGSDVGHYRSHSANDRRIVVAGNYQNKLQSGRYHRFGNKKRVGQIHAEVASTLGIPTNNFGIDKGRFPELRS